MYLRQIFSVLCACLATSAFAHDRFQPATETPVLEITFADDQYQLDIPALKTLPETTFETSTIWTDDMQTFKGVRLVDLLDHMGVTSGTAVLTAVNDYRISINLDDPTLDGALIAYERNGKPMTLREKGPLWLVYPYDEHAKFRTEVIYANSIWQLDRIAFNQ